MKKIISTVAIIIPRITVAGDIGIIENLEFINRRYQNGSRRRIGIPLPLINKGSILPRPQIGKIFLRDNPIILRQLNLLLVARPFARAMSEAQGDTDEDNDE